ncbi:MAG: hypothetical protein IKF99_21075 [Oscillospiraceae bacterium]|nr:hypothetical protein [Oscillospiraceae bacterium]
MMKNLTYRNLMIVIRKIMKKGYDFSTSEQLARNIFRDFAACPKGKSIEERISLILTAEEYAAEYSK